MYYPEIDDTGEHVANRSGSNHALLLQSLTPGNSLLIVEPPDVPSWWDGAKARWVAKSERPSNHHQWDRQTKQWHDPRTAEQVAAETLQAVRIARNAQLAASDLEALQALEHLLPDGLRVKRQALRDVPQSPDPVEALRMAAGITISP